MKLILAVILFIAIIIANSVYINADENDCGFIALLELQAIVQCSDVHQISREAVEGILNHDFVLDDHEVKCWLSCVLKKLVVIKEGKMDWDYFKHLIKHCLNNQDDKTKVDKLIRKCKAEVSQQQKDVCELAYSATACKISAWKELGLP
ncbi:unnamed protein product [Nezara viridula]|uniref:Uncharacterized protein n=1 Tax=Nezara viridula TaxID=85310 RepID=A0A9P0GYI3_NEZVI|nr:unnamed protein product [Nezara viridula]